MGASLGSQVDANVLKPFQPPLRAQEKVPESAFLSFVVPRLSVLIPSLLYAFFSGATLLFFFAHCSCFFFQFPDLFLFLFFPLRDFLDLLSSTLMF